MGVQENYGVLLLQEIDIKVNDDEGSGVVIGING